MAVLKSMKKSPPPAGEIVEGAGRILEEPLLEFPVPIEFVERRSRMGLDAIFRFSEERLPLFNARPGAEERRLREKNGVPFIL